MRLFKVIKQVVQYHSCPLVGILLSYAPTYHTKIKNLSKINMHPNKAFHIVYMAVEKALIGSYSFALDTPLFVNSGSHLFIQI